MSGGFNRGKLHTFKAYGVTPVTPFVLLSVHSVRYPLSAAKNCGYRPLTMCHRKPHCKVVVSPVLVIPVPDCLIFLNLPL
jgi:hypothetical protein